MKRYNSVDRSFVRTAKGSYCCPRICAFLINFPEGAAAPNFTERWSDTVCIDRSLLGQRKDHDITAQQDVGLTSNSRFNFQLLREAFQNWGYRLIVSLWSIRSRSLNVTLSTTKANVWRLKNKHDLQGCWLRLSVYTVTMWENYICQINATSSSIAQFISEISKLWYRIVDSKSQRYHKLISIMGIRSF